MRWASPSTPESWRMMSWMDLMTEVRLDMGCLLGKFSACTRHWGTVCLPERNNWAPGHATPSGDAIGRWLCEILVCDQPLADRYPHPKSRPCPLHIDGAAVPIFCHFQTDGTGFDEALGA